MCPNCRAFINSDDRVCQYCDFSLAPRRAAIGMTGGLIGVMIPEGKFLTFTILAVNSGLFVATIIASSKAGNPNAIMDIDGRTLVTFGAKWTGLVFTGDWWRLVTAGFLHGGLFHFLMNSWAMFDLSATVEDFFGTSRMLVIYFVATVLGFLASCFWSPAISVGASAGLFGLIGAMIAFGSMNRTAMGGMIKSHYSRWAVYGLILGLLGRIDNAAHLGGLAGGFLVARLAGSPPQTPWREAVWTWAGYASLAVTGYSFIRMFANLLRHSQ